MSLILILFASLALLHATMQGVEGGCPPLKLDHDVTVTPPSCSKSPGTTGQVCSFSCKPGHMIRGPPIKQCIGDGSWTDSHFEIKCTDIDECKINKGGCSHKCVNTDGGHYCECPSPLVLSKDKHTCKAAGVHLRCGAHDMTITVPKYLLRNLKGEFLRLQDPHCRANENATHYSLTTEHTKCGTTSRHISHYVVYSNKVLEMPTNPHHLITRVGPGEVTIPFCCYYGNQGIVHAVGFQPLAKELYLKEKGFGKFKLRLDFYDGQKFESVYAPSDFPVPVLLRQRLYFEVSVVHEDKNLEIFADNCCTTPTRDHQKAGRFRHELLHHGCPVDRTVRFHHSPSPNKRRFSFQGFKFLGNFPFVFVHCHVIVCKAGDHHSRCHRGCIPDKTENKHGHGHTVVSHGHPSVKPSKVMKGLVEQKRESTETKLVQKRAVVHPSEQSGTYVLSQGPILLNEDKKPKVKVPAKIAIQPQAEAKSFEKEPIEVYVGKTVKKDVKQPEWEASLSNALLVSLTVAALMALVGIAYLGKQLKNANSNGYRTLATTLDS